MAPVPVRRSAVHLHPDPRRVIVKSFLPGGRNPDDDRTRVEHILDRVLAMEPADVARTLDEVRTRFDLRHDDLDAVLDVGLRAVAHLLADRPALDADIRALVGAYFVHEYAIEAAALTNPSLVPAPDQTGVPDGSLRVIVSLRAIGEGHLSSIEFRGGTVDRDGEVTLDPPLAPVQGERRPPTFEGALFAAKLHEAGATDEPIPSILARLGEHFSMRELESALAEFAADHRSPATQHAVQTIHWLAASNYELAFPPASHVSQRVIFPASPAESHGMEDARFVRFEDPDGAVTHYATYTAYDGFNVLPQLVETVDFATFRIATLNGPAARNKGMALFPRQIGDRYVALGRADNENTYVMYSDHVRFWHEAARIQVPTRPWELVQIGNCGPPIETPEGWLVVTHGVGPMRTYSLGAILLALDDPRQVLGHLRDPLLVPDEHERDGYVPNVVYSCGSIVHADRLVLAYGASDSSTRFASVPLDVLLAELTSPAASAPSTAAYTAR
ncbi:MAG: glycoside hydrolase family 130 protein [Actinobacteria bacterium]|nr:glycoside hydrolase family 130 protein [Actinomycetota bacterium]